MKWTVVSLGVAAVGLLAGAAGGGVTLQSKAIHACVKRHGGAMRVGRHCRKGERGLSWAVRGVPGKKGANGPQGSAGAAGARGSAGPAGARGPTGAQGPGGGATGPRGASGATGPEGPTGVTGAKGATGAKGTTGANGATGAQGVTGAKGTTGDKGVTGPQGDSGLLGVTVDPVGNIKSWIGDQPTVTMDSSVYTLTYDHDVSGCIPQATPSGGSSTTLAVTQSAAMVNVYTFASGLPQNRGFSLVLFCGS
jgi:hypothetical protein